MKNNIALIELPGSKSYTNRALIMAALADGTSTLCNISESRDSEVMIDALIKLGVKIEKNNKTVIIHGNKGIFSSQKQNINVGLAGTAMRFLTALLTVIPGESIIDGDQRMRQRPIKDLVDALIKLGAQINYSDQKGFPPLKINGGKIKGGAVKIRGDVSSQFITAILLIAPVLQQDLTINIVDKQVSKSYIDMTIDGMREFSVAVANNNYKKYQVFNNQFYKPTKYIIEGDASGASYFWGIAAVSGRNITVSNINPRSVQGDIKFTDILKKMGCMVIKDYEKRSITVFGPKELTSVEVDMELMPDTAQTLAVIAAFAKGTTKITGLSTLKVKETDRLLALHNELKKIGIKTEITNDSIIIYGGKPKAATIETYKDHRMAMAFAVAKAKIIGININNPEVVKKSFPDFWDKFESLNT